MQKDSFLQRVMGFVEKKGFYILLGLCVLAIGISGYVLFFTGSEEPSADPAPEYVSGQVEGIPAPTLDDEKGENAEHSFPFKQPPEAPGEEDFGTKSSSSAEGEPVQTTVPSGSLERLKETVYAYPVRESEVLRPFSGDELVYDLTMRDWRTHNGTDFLCDEGDEVLAILDGTVEKVWSDPMWGNCLILDHGAGIRSLYCGLASSDTVKAGTKVSAGQTLGRAGNAIPAESEEPCHIHLELLEGDLRADPMSRLKH